MNVPPEANTHFNEDNRTKLFQEGVSTIPLSNKISNRNMSRRRWLLPIVFVAGVIVGIVLLLLFLLVFSADRAATHTPGTSTSGSITVEISRAYLASLIMYR